MSLAHSTGSESEWCFRAAAWRWVPPLVLGLSVSLPAEAQEPPLPGASPPGAPPPAEPPSNLQAGGLRPPEAVDTAPPATEGQSEAEVERELERAEQEDAGKGLSFVWLNGEIGYDLLGLQALSDSDLVDGELVESKQSGLTYGAGLGVRLFVLTLGGRFRYATYADARRWSLNAEGGLRIPLGKLEVFVAAGAGYTSLGGFASDSASVDLSKMSISGFDVRLGGGVDYFLSSAFSVGASVNGEVTFLSRDALDVSDMPQGAQAVYADDGSGIGAGMTALAVVGLHF